MSLVLLASNAHMCREKDVLIILLVQPPRALMHSLWSSSQWSCQVELPSGVAKWSCQVELPSGARPLVLHCTDALSHCCTVLALNWFLAVAWCAWSNSVVPLCLEWLAVAWHLGPGVCTMVLSCCLCCRPLAGVPASVPGVPGRVQCSCLLCTRDEVLVVPS